LIDTLPPDQQAALVLKVLEGRSSAEIGEILGCSEGAVEQKLVRARSALRERREGT
jgi:RNA polymerase sigma-70 factor (ECF subfamily)